MTSVMSNADVIERIKPKMPNVNELFHFGLMYVNPNFF